MGSAKEKKKKNNKQKLVLERGILYMKPQFMSPLMCPTEATGWQQCGYQPSSPDGEDPAEDHLASAVWPESSKLVPPGPVTKP